MFTRLHNLELCTTYKTLLSVLDEASLGHDEKVHDWQEEQAHIAPQQSVVRKSSSLSLLILSLFILLVSSEFRCRNPGI